VGLGDVSLACATALVDELVRGGVEHACLSPGSRSTPLALALARHPDITLHVYLDERSSAFIAVGISKASHAPVAVACTSGTAAAELFPAVVEASQSRTPLILMTADRPPRLRGTGANQTIDQDRIFGSYARALVDPPVPERDEDVQTWRAAGRKAIEAAGAIPNGPAHLNCPFEEPLVPERRASAPGRRGRSVVARVQPVEPVDVHTLAGELSGARGAVLIGPMPAAATRSLLLADALGWPVLAEPLSGSRDPRFALAAGQSLAGDDPWRGAHPATVVLQIGATPTTRASQRLAAGAARLVVVDSANLDPDPERRSAIRVHADAEHVAERLLETPIEPAGADWLVEWRAADAVARAALDEVLDAEERPTGLRVARDVAATIPPSGSLLVGNSTPVRDLDAAMVPRTGLRVLGNRGASGIDGLVSTAIGVATALTGPTFALIGDLSLVHDLGSLVWSARHDPPNLTIVVVDNGGGQIFSLVGHGDLPERDELFVTPHHADIEALARAAGASHMRVERSAELAAALEDPQGLRVVSVVVDPQRDREIRERVRLTVGAALAGL
jgi:2-succinyl-5-enolpyruvyl-6-hydroxy-3-cyclohexene-1-carboxylate synthase